ncbi:restriction endonuclease subunit R [bacterium]|nr:MAG: restriction endonuclease subunit R [bacterium]
MSAPKEVLRLVEQFERNLDSYKSGRYNEAQLRKEFLDPFFKALGWDMDNAAGLAEAYKDVVHEDAIRIGGAVKAPDYCFRIGGTRKFFLEAKKPSVAVGQETSAAYQLRRYAWSAKLPLSILSDFEEFVVYDCRIKPNKPDSAATARVFICGFRDFPEKWDWIASIFSKDAVLKGSFDKYAETNKAKRGTAGVDDDFLATIEHWRSELARNLALRNSGLSQRELNFAVQRIIDRIIFLRICEDRGIELYGRLLALTNGPNIYGRLCEVFEDADAKYNSGLFHFKSEKERHESPDGITLGLKVDDKLLEGLLKGLYYPESPYEFTVIPSDILGQVYEQFLGKVIRLTEGHHAVVEDKPEVKKAGGVYYTPTYIVDYIVKQTVGKLVEGKTSKQIAKLCILDPACGSGSFLINAYQFLLDWHRDWYIAHDPGKWAKSRDPVLVQTTTGWKLTIPERKKILLDKIYGVDIDPQAVEVTKLSLLMKVLEGENEQTIQPFLRLFHQRALPDLGDNIKCGNSLIGPDFYQQPNLLAMSDDEKFRINVFDWDTEFPEIMKSGGFDVVMGNPPYIRQESLSDFKGYFAQDYEAYDGVADIYAYFMEKGVKLLNNSGLFSIIVSSSFLRAAYAKPLRRTLKKYAAVLRIVDFGGLPIFANAKDTYVCIPLFVKSTKQIRVEISRVSSLEIRNLDEHVSANHFTIPHERLSPEAWSLKSDEEAAVFAKVLKAGIPLGEYVERKLFYGLKTGLNEAFEITGAQRAALIKASPASKALIKPFLGGQDIRRFLINDEGRYLIVIPCGWTRREIARTKKGSAPFSEREAWNWFSGEYKNIAEHLAPFADALRKRQDQGDYWWELRPCDYYEYFDSPKIIFPDICKGPRFFLDRSGIYLANTAYCLGIDDPYLLGILNSRLFWFAISNISIPFGIRAGQYRYRLIYQYMEKVPIHVIDYSNSVEVALHDRLVVLANQMQRMYEQLHEVLPPYEKEFIQRRIDASDKEIDHMVYQLYKLTREEIKIIDMGIMGN